MLDPSLPVCVFLSRFQSPSRCSKDGSPADVESSELTTMRPRTELSATRGVQSENRIKKRDKNMSTETSPLVLLMNQGTVALGSCRKCCSIANKNSPAVQSPQN